ncbi:MAG: hypothetical protein JAZ02_06340 [Candidatus Thiodiazotropha endolucinida]|nr:hypothetical protein [Candidatus Thiodiazotropha endolucinida]
MESKDMEFHVNELAESIAEKAGVDVEAAARVLKALNVTSQIEVAASLSGGSIDADKVKLAYRIASGGVVA